MKDQAMPLPESATEPKESVAATHEDLKRILSHLASLLQLDKEQRIMAYLREHRN